MEIASKYKDFWCSTKTVLSVEWKKKNIRGKTDISLSLNLIKVCLYSYRTDESIKNNFHSWKIRERDSWWWRLPQSRLFSARCRCNYHKNLENIKISHPAQTQLFTIVLSRVKTTSWLSLPGRKMLNVISSVWHSLNI